MIAWFYWNDVGIDPKPLSLVVRLVVLQGGAKYDNEIEMIEVLSLSRVNPRLSVSPTPVGATCKH